MPWRNAQEIFFLRYGAVAGSWARGRGVHTHTHTHMLETCAVISES